MVAEICRQYLDALNKGHLEKVMSLFEPGAMVVSPLYGEIPAIDFYKGLFEDTNRSETKLINIFTSIGEKSSAALHFQYKWTLRSGKIVEFECVDVFEITQDGKKFSKLKIIYDTASIRVDFDESKAMT